MSFAAGAITGLLTLDTSGYVSAIAQAASGAQGAAATLTRVLGGAMSSIADLARRAGGAVLGLLSDVAHGARDTALAAERAGVSLQFMSGVGAAARASGSSVEGLGDSLKFLNNNAADAAAGNETTVKSFTALGLTVTDASGKLKSTESLFFEVADAIAALPTAAQKTQAAMNLLGRGGVDIIPTLNKGSAGIKQFAAEMNQLSGATQAVSRSAQQITRLGVSVGFMDGLGAAAKASGASVEGLGESIRSLSAKAAGAAGGNAAALKSFTALGLTVTDASGKLKSTESLFFEVADAIAALPTAAQKSKAAMDLLGRGGADILPAINKGSAGIKQFTAELGRFGDGAGESLAHSAEQFEHMEAVVSAAWAGIRKAVAEPVLQYVSAHFGEISAMVKQVAGSIRQTIGQVMPSIIGAIPSLLEFGAAVVKGLISTFQVAAPVLKAILPLLSSLGELATAVLVPVFQLLQPILEAIAKTLTTISNVVGTVVNALGSVVHGVTDALGFTSPQSPAADAAAGAPAAGGVTIQKVEAHVPAVDTNAASSQIAAKLQGPLREGLQRQQRSMEQAGRSDYVLRSL